MAMHRAVVVLALFAIVVSAAEAAGADSPAKFRKLTGAEIRARVVGNRITDEAHWSEFFNKDGSIAVVSMGRKSTGRWRIDKDTLCTWTRSVDGECYEVWVSGSEIQLRVRGEDPPYTAYLRKGE